ncbi:hypothetical protein WKW77_27165 [Variovorax ureilyticus]|uniref:Uncharacterized protein n=1 Tax=Variovorax ureilyticus TaxID=1836198 RepID=A0ABU8VMP3_9BURK
MDTHRLPAGTARPQRPIEIAFVPWPAIGQRRSARPVSARSRFPAMFSGPHAGITLYRGWNPILAAACREIQQAVEFRGLGFRWVRIEEEDGVAALFYALGERSRFVIDLANSSRRAVVLNTHARADDLVRYIDCVVLDAERLSAEACMVCGAHSRRRNYFGRDLPLCDRHQPEFLNASDEEGLEGLWREAIEWEER